MPIADHTGEHKPEIVGSTPTFVTNNSMSLWWNWQTRQTKDLVRKGVGSTPTLDTNISVAQLVELAALNRKAVGSSPTGDTDFHKIE